MLKSVFSILQSPPIRNKVCETSGLIRKQFVSNLFKREFHLTYTQLKFDKRALLAALPKKDEGVEGEKIVDIDSVAAQKSAYPDINTPNQLFDGTPFKELPIINIKCTPNNTLMSLSDYKGNIVVSNSCGTEGFKHARKATNIAAQATAVAMATKALNKGFKTFRVRIRGLGPGRMSCIRGLQLGGINVISVTDYTKVTWCPLRPRKAKRL